MWNSREFEIQKQLERIDRERAEEKEKQKQLEKTASYNIGGGAAVGFKVGCFVDFANLFTRGPFIPYMGLRLALAGAATGTIVYAVKKIKPD